LKGDIVKKYVAMAVNPNCKVIIKIEEQALVAIPTSLTFAPFSVNIYEFPVNND
jgi:hypothetical protein